eukprot:TRINITY_DN13670_c0_g1_i1.p1 TRINITY_DN13670_c0_g1~~TRINITY_DN13670_c0_g1_i1.p1  ORF type:complete len:468 (+),score=85.12 TRINITY_DN13670_c0_g1_i1:20-1423(+)
MPARHNHIMPAALLLTACALFLTILQSRTLNDAAFLQLIAARPSAGPQLLRVSGRAERPDSVHGTCESGDLLVGALWAAAAAVVGTRMASHLQFQRRTGGCGQRSVRGSSVTRLGAAPHGRDAPAAAGRREISVGLAGAFGISGFAHHSDAEVTPPITAAQPPVPVPSPSVAASTAPLRLRRTVIDVGSNDALDKELKFWTSACEMKVLSDTADAKGNRTAVVGFDSSFGIEFKVDPAVLTRPTPTLMNWSVMQPTVNALNFHQLTGKGQVFDIYGRVENSGGTSLIGDARYLDCESPRGVQVRIVPRETPSCVELVGLNVEVPAFAGALKIYEKFAGFAEITYNVAEEPPIQERSALLQSPAGGPKILLSPVPDFRIKQRDRDEFVNFSFASPDLKKSAQAAQAAIAAVQEDEKAKDEAARENFLQKGEQVPEILRKGTLPKPTLDNTDGKLRVDDGVGNILLVSE